MSLELLATTKANVKAEAVSPGTWSPGTQNEVLIPDLFTKAQGTSVAVTTVTTVPTVCTLSGGTFVSGAGVILASAQEPTLSGLKPMRDTDTGLCAGAFIVGTASTPCACKLTLENPGQEKVKGI